MPAPKFGNSTSSVRGSRTDWAIYRFGKILESGGRDSYGSILTESRLRPFPNCVRQVLEDVKFNLLPRTRREEPVGH